MDEEDGILLSHEKEWNLTICSSVGALKGHYAKWKKSEKDWDRITSLICGIQKKRIQRTSEYHTQEAESQIYREQAGGYHWGEGSEKGQHRSRGLIGTNYYV